MITANQGDPILSLDGERVIAFWVEGLSFTHGNSFTWTPMSTEELVAGPEMTEGADGNLSHRNEITVALEYARGPIQVWRVVALSGGTEEDAFRLNSAFSLQRQGSDADLARALRLVLASDAKTILASAMHLTDYLTRYAEALEDRA